MRMPLCKQLHLLLIQILHVNLGHASRWTDRGKHTVIQLHTLHILVIQSAADKVSVVKVCAALTCGAVCAVEQVDAEFELVQRVYLLWRAAQQLICALPITAAPWAHSALTNHSPALPTRHHTTRCLLRFCSLQLNDKAALHTLTLLERQCARRSTLQTHAQR